MANKKDISIALVSILAVFIFAAASFNAEEIEASSSDGLHTEQSSIPECASKDAIDFLKDTIERDSTVQMLDYSGIQQFQYDETENKRTCIMQLVTTSGKSTILYAFSPAKSDPSQTLLEIQELSALEAYQLEQIQAMEDATAQKRAEEEKIYAEIDKQTKVLENCYRNASPLTTQSIIKCQKSINENVRLSATSNTEELCTNLAQEQRAKISCTGIDLAD